MYGDTLRLLARAANVIRLMRPIGRVGRVLIASHTSDWADQQASNLTMQRPNSCTRDGIIR